MAGDEQQSTEGEVCRKEPASERRRTFFRLLGRAALASPLVHFVVLGATGTGARGAEDCGEEGADVCDPLGDPSNPDACACTSCDQTEEDVCTGDDAVADVCECGDDTGGVDTCSCRQEECDPAEGDTTPDPKADYCACDADHGSAAACYICNCPTFEDQHFQEDDSHSDWCHCEADRGEADDCQCWYDGGVEDYCSPTCEDLPCQNEPAPPECPGDPFGQDLSHPAPDSCACCSSSNDAGYCEACEEQDSGAPVVQSDYCTCGTESPSSCWRDNASCPEHDCGLGDEGGPDYISDWCRCDEAQADVCNCSEDGTPPPTCGADDHDDGAGVADFCHSAGRDESAYDFCDCGNQESPDPDWCVAPGDASDYTGEGEGGGE